MIRVAHIIQNLNYGGMERLIADLVRLADRTTYDAHVVVLQYPGRFAEEMRGFGTVHQCDPLPSWSMMYPGPLIGVLRAIAPDVVHSHSGVWYKASLAARRAGVPRVVHTEHGRRARDTWLARTVERRAARRTDAVVAVSDALADHLAREVVPRHKLHVIPNGVDTDRFAPRPDAGALRRELGIAVGIPVIGSIGRLEPIKAYALMLEAFAKLIRNWNSGPLPVLVLAGDGSERARLAAQAMQLGIAEHLHLLGWRDDVHDLHAAFQVFSLSSLSEGTSVSLLEAMSAGLCPVVTDVGGNRAVLGPALQHRLVPPRDADALAAAWGVALTQPSSRAADAVTARARVVSAFGVRTMVHRYEELYRGPETAA